jgi:hypothetical protein
MDLYLRKKITSLLLYSFIILLPFLVFYWMIPFKSVITIGHDYLKYSINHQIAILFSIKKGSFPLYIPGYASGQSSTALTLGQVFHPISHLSSIMPGYWDGKVIEWNNFFKLLSLGITHLALFLFLKSINLRAIYCFLLSFITVYNLRMLELYHHGAPLEAYTGFLILCSFIGLYFINQKNWLYFSGVIISAYLLICSGHPEDMYYGVLGAGLFTLVAPFFLSDVLNNGREINFTVAFKFWLKIGGCFLISLLLSFAYVLPFYFEFVSNNFGRVGQDYSWANSNLDSFMGTINNFLLPLRSEVHSAFGGSSLFLMALIVPLLRFFRIKIPRSIWITWGILLFIFLHMQGNRTPVHRLTWEYLPFASSIKEPGRISTIMPLFIMILMVWIIKANSTTKTSNLFKPLTIAAFVSCLLIITYYLTYFTGYYIFNSSIFLKYFRPYFDRNFLQFSFSYTYKRIEFLLVVLGIISLILLFISDLRIRSKITTFSGVILLVIVIFQVGLILRYRGVNFVENIRDTPTLEEIEIQKQNKLDYLYYPGQGMHSSIVTKQLNNSFMEPFLGKIFTQIISVKSQNEAYKLMREQRLPQQVFIEGYDSIKAEEITEKARYMKNGVVKLIYSSFNRLKFRVRSETPAILGLSYPYTGHWRAWVNGRKVHVYRANGAAHAVEIPKGESIVEFRYWSNAFFWGILISCSTFIIVGLSVSFRTLKGLKRITGIVLVLIAGIGVFMLWYNSLYTGDNLKTKYTWTYTPPSKTPNLAYGKKNWMNRVYSHRAFRDMARYTGRLVDGNIAPGSGFVTCYYKEPAWFIDLARIEEISKIVFYYSNKNPIFLNIFRNCSFVEREAVDRNESTIEILFSNNNMDWTSSRIFRLQKDKEGIKTINFNKPLNARFVQIKLHGKGQLMFDEVEIYGQ